MKASHQLHGPCFPLSSVLCTRVTLAGSWKSGQHIQDLELRVLLGSSSKREVRIMDLLGWVSVEARKVQRAPTGAHPMPDAAQPSRNTAVFGAASSPDRCEQQQNSTTLKSQPKRQPSLCFCQGTELTLPQCPRSVWGDTAHGRESSARGFLIVSDRIRGAGSKHTNAM